MTQPDPCAEALALECATMADAIGVMAEERASDGSKGSRLIANGMLDAADYIRAQHPIEES